MLCESETRLCSLRWPCQVTRASCVQTEKTGNMYVDCTETLANTVHNNHICTQYTGASDLKRNFNLILT